MNSSALSSDDFDNEDLVGSVPPHIVTRLRHLPPLLLCALVAVFATLCTQFAIFLVKCFCRAIYKVVHGRRRRRRVGETEGTERRQSSQKNAKPLCYSATLLTPTRKSRRAAEGTKAVTIDGDNAGRAGHTVVDFGGGLTATGKSKRGQHQENNKQTPAGENPFELILPDNEQQQGEDVLVEIARTVPTFD